jgi:tetratricopeptide (TPR) repeat protein
MRRSLARTLADLERLDEAEAELLGLVDTVERAERTGELPSVLEALGEVYSRQGRVDEAESCFRRSINMLEEQSPGDPLVGLAWAGLARVYRDAGRAEEATTAYRTGIHLMEEGWGADDPDLRRAADELAEMLGGAGGPA